MSPKAEEPGAPPEQAEGKEVPEVRRSPALPRSPPGAPREPPGARQRLGEQPAAQGWRRPAQRRSPSRYHRNNPRPARASKGSVLCLSLLLQLPALAALCAPEGGNLPREAFGTGARVGCAERWTNGGGEKQEEQQGQPRGSGGFGEERKGWGGVEAAAVLTSRR